MTTTNQPKQQKVETLRSLITQVFQQRLTIFNNTSSHQGLTLEGAEDLSDEERLEFIREFLRIANSFRPSALGYTDLERQIDGAIDELFIEDEDEDEDCETLYI